MKNSAFGFDEPEDSPGFLLWQTTIIWQRLIKKALEPYNIAHAQFVILAITLWYAQKGQHVSQSVIISQSKLDKMTVSKSLKKLVADGYVKRIENAEDTRSKSVYLTEKGKNLTLKMVPIVEKIDAQFFSTLKKPELNSIINIFNELIAHN